VTNLPVGIIPEDIDNGHVIVMAGQPGGPGLQYWMLTSSFTASSVGNSALVHTANAANLDTSWGANASDQDSYQFSMVHDKNTGYAGAAYADVNGSSVVIRYVAHKQHAANFGGADGALQVSFSSGPGLSVS